MTLNSNDWKKLQASLLTLCGVLIAAAILISFTIRFETQQAVLLTQQNDQLMVAKQKYLSSGAEKKEIEANLPQYEALIQKGFIGEEHRQMWVQALQDIQKQYQLFPIEYKLLPLENITPTFFPNLGQFQLHQSQMNLNFNLLHEGDVLTLTESLANKEMANWLLKSCKITKNKPLAVNHDNLTAECTIDWFTLSEPVNTP